MPSSESRRLFCQWSHCCRRVLARLRRVGSILITIVGSLVSVSGYAIGPVESAELLRSKVKSMSVEFDDNQFRRAIHLESRDSAEKLEGEVYSIVDYPFATVSEALSESLNWCDVLMLHFNVKYCDAAESSEATTLSIGLGKKYEQPLADAYQIQFVYRRRSFDPNYFSIELTAGSGPLSTRDYHFEVEAIPAVNERTLIHLTYSYAFGMSGRLAMHGYLATTGRDKMGFTITGRTPAGEPIYIRGVRGVIERNTMRYCLAIEAYLAALGAPPKEQLEKRLQYWYRSTEQYARQLHEMDLDDYLALKRHENARLQGG